MLTVRVFAVVAMFVVILSISWGAISQHSPKTPKIDSKQQAYSALKQQEHADTNSKSAERPENKSKHDADHGGKEPPETYVAFGKSLKITDTAIAVFTFVIALFTIGLFWEEVDRSRKELRAYLGIPDPIVQRLGDGNHFQVQVTVTNTGNTPAMGVRRWMLSKLVKKDESIDFAEHELHPANRPIPPDSKWHLRQDFVEWSDDDINAITKYDKILWVWGQVAYQDIYGKPHTTNFRLRSLAHRFKLVEFQSNKPDGTTQIERIVMTDGWTLEPDAEGNNLT